MTPITPLYAFHLLINLVYIVLWILIAFAGVVALVRTRKVAIGLQIFGALMVLLLLVGNFLVYNLLPRTFMGSLPDWYNIYNIAQPLASICGMILFAIGYCMEKFMKPANSLDRGFPVSNVGLPPQTSNSFR